MRISPILFSTLLLLPGLLLAQPEPAPAEKAKAEVKVGLGLEKRELTGASEKFDVAAGTKVYAWTRVSGTPKDAKVTIAFLKGDREVFKTEQGVPASPYRTFAYRTFRKGDDGSWTARVVGPDGTEIGSTNFQVTITGP
jgi:hypothetical protein